MSKLERALPDRWIFQCPGCDDLHQVNDSWQVTPGDNPTISPSVLTTYPAGHYKDGVFMKSERICHLFVRDGKIEYLGDSWHSLAGTTIDMVEVDL